MKWTRRLKCNHSIKEKAFNYQISKEFNIPYETLGQRFLLENTKE